MYYLKDQMNEIQMYGLKAALLGAMYAVYWLVTYIQLQLVEPIPAGNMTMEQFAQTNPNLDRAFRFLDYDPFNEDCSHNPKDRGILISKQMLRHGWGGLAFLFLGACVAAYRANTIAFRIAFSIAVIGFTASLAMVFILHPHA